MSKRTLSIGTFILAILLPVVVSAVIGASAVKTWNSPIQKEISAYAYTDTISYAGTVQLPADWFGRVRIYKDGTNLIASNVTFDNRGLATTTYPFNVNTGIWTSGDHIAEIRFDGASACRLVCTDTDTDCINNSFTDPAVVDWCPKSSDNQAIDQIYPSRTIAIGPPPTPVLSISAGTMNFFSKVKGSPTVTATVSLSNTGGTGTIAAGTVSQVSGSGIFACQSGCSYTIAPGDAPHQVTIAFIPPATVGTHNGSFSLPCVACSGGQTLVVTGKTINASSPSKIAAQPSPVDFGPVAVGGGSANSWFYIENIGGTPMTGTITLPANGQYSCDPTCNFSLDPGEGTNGLDLLFSPTLAGNLNGTAVISASGGAANLSVPLKGVGLDSPYLGVWYEQGQYDLDDSALNIIDVNSALGIINVGEEAVVGFLMENSLAGLLSAQVFGLPSGDGVFTCVDGDNDPGDDGCALVTGIEYWGINDANGRLEVHMTSPDTAVHTITLQFRNMSVGATQPPITLKLSMQASDGPRIEVTNGDGVCRFNFGNVLVGSSSLPRANYTDGNGYRWVSKCTIQNTGTQNALLTLPTSFTRSGAGPFGSYGSADFTCVTGSGLSCGSFTLTPGQQTKFQYKAVPTAAASYHDFEPVNTNSGGPRGFLGFTDLSFLRMRLGGIELVGKAFAGSVPPNDFGAVNIGQVSTQKKSYDVAVWALGGKNLWSYPLTYPGAMNYTVTNSAHFRCIAFCSGTLTPSGGTATRTPQFEFVPGSDIGVITENVSINYNFGTWTPPSLITPILISFTGTGNDQPVLDITGDIIPPVVDFGPTNVGLPGYQNLVLTNIGVGTLTGTIGAFPSGFSCVSGCGALSIPAGGSVPVKLSFSPTTNIPYEGIVNLTTNGGNRALTLRGTGIVQPQLSVSTTFMNFDILDPAGYTEVGNVKTATFTVKNIGLGTMVGTASLFAPTSHFFVPPQSFSLVTGQEKEITVQFSPLQDGIPLSAIVHVAATDGGGGWSDAKDVSLQGTGAFAALIDFRGTEPNFGGVVSGKNKEKDIVIGNAGVRPFGQGTFDFPVGSPFTCVSPIDPGDGKCHYNIGSNGEATIRIRFSPTSLGAFNVSMIMSSLPEYPIHLTGQGLPPRFNYKEQ